MYFRRLLNDESACGSYLLGCKTQQVRRRRPARRARIIGSSPMPGLVTAPRPQRGAVHGGAG